MTTTVLEKLSERRDTRSRDAAKSIDALARQMATTKSPSKQAIEQADAVLLEHGVSPQEFQGKIDIVREIQALRDAGTDARKPAASLHAARTAVAEFDAADRLHIEEARIRRQELCQDANRHAVELSAAEDRKRQVDLLEFQSPGLAGLDARPDVRTFTATSLGDSCDSAGQIRREFPREVFDQERERRCHLVATANQEQFRKYRERIQDHNEKADALRAKFANERWTSPDRDGALAKLDKAAPQKPDDVVWKDIAKANTPSRNGRAVTRKES